MKFLFDLSSPRSHYFIKESDPKSFFRFELRSWLTFIKKPPPTPRRLTPLHLSFTSSSFYPFLLRSGSHDVSTNTDVRWLRPRVTRMKLLSLSHSREVLAGGQCIFSLLNRESRKGSNQSPMGYNTTEHCEGPYAYPISDLPWNVD